MDLLSPAYLPAFDGREPGRYLRVCRELAGLTLAQLHERTRIRPRQLESIESERYAGLPPDAYLRGHVRQLARVIGAPDADAVADAFVAGARRARAAAEPVRPRRRWASWRTRPALAPPVAPLRPRPDVAELAAACFTFEPELDGFAGVDAGGEGLCPEPD